MTLLEKIKADEYILQAVKKRKRKAQKTLCIYTAIAFALAVLVCILAEATLFGWVIALLCATAVSAVIWLLYARGKREERVFVGKIERLEEDRKIVPQKGTAFFGRLPSKLVEVHELVILITDERQASQVIFCPRQYEKILEIGDTLLCHSALPYPALLSNPTKCICMHCGTMQSSEHSSCITCGATMYSVLQLSKQGELQD